MKKLFLIVFMISAAFAEDDSFFDSFFGGGSSDSGAGLFSDMDSDSDSDESAGAEASANADTDRGDDSDTGTGAGRNIVTIESKDTNEGMGMPEDKKSAKEGGLNSNAAMSFGASIVWAGDFGGGVEYSGNNEEFQNRGYDSYVMPLYGFGLQFFFDARYAEASLTMFWGSGTWEQQKGDKTRSGTDEDASLFSVNIEALGKFPIPVNERMTAYPLAGIAYHIALSGERGKSGVGGAGKVKFDGNGVDNLYRENPDATDFSALWFKFGGGLNTALSEKLYVRTALLYGIRLANSYEDGILNDAVKDIEGASSKPRLGHGLTIKAGVGMNL